MVDREGLTVLRLRLTVIIPVFGWFDHPLYIFLFAAHTSSDFIISEKDDYF
jgi:hypothetical protein